MIEVYTAITAAYDDLRPQPVLPGVSYTAFLEPVFRNVPPWRAVPLAVEAIDPTRRAKRPKVLAHEYFPEAEYSMWIDGTVTLSRGSWLSDWIELYLRDVDVATSEHPRHASIYEHGEFVMRQGLDARGVVAAQLERYRAAGFQSRSGCVQCKYVFRRHTPEVKRFNERWWKEIEEGSRRDQLSFQFAAEATGVSYAMLPYSLQQHFQDSSHRGKRYEVPADE